MQLTMMLFKRLNIINQLKIAILVLPILVILLKKTDCNTKIYETEKKTNNHDQAKYITAQEFHKLTAVQQDQHRQIQQAKMILLILYKRQILMIM